MTLAPTRPAEPQTAQIIEELTSPERFPGRKRWTRDECSYLERWRMLPNRYELIDGAIIEKTNQNLLHGTSVIKVILWLAGIFGEGFVGTQVAVEIDEADRATNFPEPDVFVVTQPFDTYKSAPPASELRLFVEVSDSTLRGDLTTKAALYARAGISEYWVLDVTGRRLFVHRNPMDGVYTSVERYSETESVATEASPEMATMVADLLPPVSAEA